MVVFTNPAANVLFAYHGLFILDLDPALVGLSLAYSITLTGMFQYCVRVSAEVENLVNIYTMHL